MFIVQPTHQVHRQMQDRAVAFQHARQVSYLYPIQVIVVDEGDEKYGPASIARFLNGKQTFPI